jgi:hypothetical protein
MSLLDDQERNRVMTPANIIDRELTETECDELLDCVELQDVELNAVSGGVFVRITNVRVNANGITGGGPLPSTA